MKKTKIGIVGCGMISETYFNASKKFTNIEVVACSDIIPERSKAKFEAHGVPNMTNDELFAIPEIEIVLNLTPPQVHSKIAMDTLNAGKHAYSEKPFGRRCRRCGQGRGSWRRKKGSASAAPRTPSSAAASRPPAR